MPATEIRIFRDDSGVSPFLIWLENLKKREPRAHRKCLFLLLALADQGAELRRPLADTLRNGIRELRARVGNVNYRILYSFHGSHVAVVSHGITKERDVPDEEIDLAVKRMALVRKNPEKYTCDFEEEK